MESSLLNGIRVLVVDDSPDSQLLAKIYLKKMGASVDGADDGHEAFSKVTNSNYDVILMDISMPGIDGYETTRLMRKSGVKTPIVALTAHAMESAKLQSIESGCTAHVTKPIDLKQLARTVLDLANPQA